MTKLGDRRQQPPQTTGAAPVPVSIPTKLAARRGNVARGEYAELPGLGRAFIRLPGRNAMTAVEAAVFDSLAKAGIPAIQLHAFTYDQERKARTLAIAARDPDDHRLPFGTTEEWLEEDDDIIFASGLIYDDVKERLDPASSETVDEVTREQVFDAFKKKDFGRLRLFGAGTLARLLISGEFQRSSYPTPSSSTSESSAESSDP
jgi:hypothetical protein